MSRVVKIYFILMIIILYCIWFTIRKIKLFAVFPYYLKSLSGFIKNEDFHVWMSFINIVFPTTSSCLLSIAYKQKK